MSTLDVVAQAGGRPANFLDAGGGSKAEAITSAVEVILSNPQVSAVLFNIFGGITRCDEVASGLIEAFAQIEPTVPFVVRLDGTNDVEGRRLLAEANLPNVHTESTMLDAANASWSWPADGRSRRLEHAPLRLRHHRPRGHLPLAQQPQLRHPGGVRRDPRQGRPGRGGHPGVRHLPPGGGETGANTAMVFVPPRFAADSILEAEDAGIELIVTITEGIPAHDELKVYNHLARNPNVRLVGPNCPGILSPGKANVGIIPASFFKEGNVAWCRAPGR